MDAFSISRSFVSEYYKIRRSFPTEENFGMLSQIRRAALSVHLNIAEGASGKSAIERKRFYEISRGSLIEVDAAFDIARELNYLNNYDLHNLGEKIIRCCKILSGMIDATKPH